MVDLLAEKVSEKLGAPFPYHASTNVKFCRDFSV